MCNYTRAKPNSQQCKASPDPQPSDKERDAFFDQLTDFKNCNSGINELSYWSLNRRCLSRSEDGRYTVKHAGAQTAGSSTLAQKSPQCSRAAWFVLGLVKRQLVLKGIGFPVTGLHVLLISKFSLLCSTLTFHREIRSLAFSALPQGTRIPPQTDTDTISR